MPRIPLIPSDDNNIPFKRIQFPIKVSFAMTINRVQSKSIQHLACDFTKPPFTHGQLCVALSRITNPDNLKLLLPPNKCVPNPVFHEVL